jgi:hypothetical protein
MTTSKHNHFETRFITRITPYANFFAAVWDGSNRSAGKAASGMQNYTRVAFGASFENFIARI